MDFWTCIVDITFYQVEKDWGKNIIIFNKGLFSTLSLLERTMDLIERKQLFSDIFATKSGEKVLILFDIPHSNIKDTNTWKKRREMVKEWYQTFKIMGDEVGFSVDIIKFKATGIHNLPIPQEISDKASKYNLVLAMTEYSATTSLIKLITTKDTITRCASMPSIEKKMEETALKTDYTMVQKYAIALEKILNNAIAAEISFSTGDNLYIDLRNRVAKSDKGVCRKTGQSINVPSGEACIVPYEATQDEIKKYGESKTEGILPVRYQRELVKFNIKNNKIIEIIGNGEESYKMRNFFEENDTRRNIAELGIGCNPNAVVTGNILEDEKAGLHVAYGKSTHLGGKIESDMHMDVCYAKGCPVEGRLVTLINTDGTKTELIQNAILRYDLLK
jgi:leucyl aminopeptidase (aminopeptidase T)